VGRLINPSNHFALHLTAATLRVTTARALEDSAEQAEMVIQKVLLSMSPSSS
jgi:hypothetical protein